MLFNSFPFLLFLLTVFSLYYLSFLKKYQIIVLIAGSLFFYAWEGAHPFILLIVSIVVNAFASYQVAQTVNTRIKIFYLIVGIVYNVGLLTSFKLLQSLNTGSFSIYHPINFLLSLSLPIGLSFYCLQGISLLVDVFRNDFNERTKVIPSSPIQHLTRSLLFISFFPHSLAGPIVRAYNFLPQISEKKFNQIDWEYCFRKLVIGYFLKMVVADNLKHQTLVFMEYPNFLSLSGLTLVFLTLGFACQVFADFAGYSSIALGLAGLFGYQLKRNFNFPYLATSFSEFWQRWHISLSTFLKLYVYKPLGGSKKGNARTALNILLTMIIGGLWHGLSWVYLGWGTLHGLFLVLERFINKVLPSKNKLPWVKGFSWIIIFLLISFSCLCFRYSSHFFLLRYLQHIYNNQITTHNYDIILFIIMYSIPVILYHLYAKYHAAFITIQKYNFIVFAIMIFLIITNSGPASSFIYFRF